MVTWVIQTNLIDQDQTNKVATAARNYGADVIPVNVIPFVDDIDLWEEPKNLNVIPYGSTKLSKLAKTKGWRGMFLNDFFSTVEWNKNRNDMLNQNSLNISVKDAVKYMENFKDEESFFIRPVEDLKVFAGAVTSAKEIKNWMNSKDSGNFSFDEDTMVSIHTPQIINCEWRWFVVNGKVIDGSLYRIRGQRYIQHEDDPKVIEEAQSLADVWLPHKTCVMDLALTPGGVKVIEFNCFNSSGFYDHDIKKIVKATCEIF